MTYFISGHRDLTWEEFTKWYAPAISKVICTDKEAGISQTKGYD